MFQISGNNNSEEEIDKVSRSMSTPAQHSKEQQQLLALDKVRSDTLIHILDICDVSDKIFEFQYVLIARLGYG